MSTTPISYKIEDLVWAKMKGFSPWPGKVSEPPAELKKPKKPTSLYCIFFFGSNNYAWIEETNIKPYTEFKNTLISTSKSTAFKHACSMIESYMEDPEKFNSEMGASKIDDEFNRLKDNSEKGKKEKLTKKEKVKSAVIARKRSSSANGAPKKRSRTLSNASSSEEVVPNNIVSSRTSHSTYVQDILENRPDTVELLEVPPIDVCTMTQTLKNKNVVASTLQFGFLGLGNMGQGLVKNLLNSGHNVIIWNRTNSKCEVFAKAGAEIGLTPMDVVQAADITFSCVSDPQAAKDMVFGNCGVLNATNLEGGKGYVEMTGIDFDTAQDIADAIISRGGRYLEAQLQGSKDEANLGNLIILAAGDKSLFTDCQSCFEAMGKTSFFLGGEAGHATKVNCVLQLINGITIAGLAEGMALADRAGLQKKDILDILKITNFASKQLVEKSKLIMTGTFDTQTALTHMQKDMKLALGMADHLEQPLPVTASANEIYKHAKRLGYADHDVAAVYIRSRF